MKKFIPQGPQHIVTRASFMATQTNDRTTRNERYDLYRIHVNSKGIPTGGEFFDDDGKLQKFHEFMFPERCPIRVDESFDNWKVQKRRLRYRRMMIRAFMKQFVIGTSIHPYAFSSKKQAKQLASRLTSNYFTDDGHMIAEYINIPEHEIDQQFFDQWAYEEITCW